MLRGIVYHVPYGFNDIFGGNTPRPVLSFWKSEMRWDLVCTTFNNIFGGNTRAQPFTPAHSCLISEECLSSLNALILFLSF